VQGEGDQSQLVGQTVTVDGVVTAIAEDGFFLQSLHRDRRRTTSEGLFVQGPTGRIVGEHLRATGTVVERRGNERELSVTTLVVAERLDHVTDGHCRRYSGAADCSGSRCYSGGGFDEVHPSGTGG
jgi:predicted extracellular nuclease